MARIMLTMTLMLALLAGAGCGSKKGETAKGPAFPEEALKPLTDEEITRFVQAVPSVTAALQAAGYHSPDLGQDAHIVTVVTSIADGMKDVAGLNETLANAGTNWQDFRGTLLRVLAASAALNADMVSQMMAGMAQNDTSAQVKEAKRRVEELKNACAGVPAENKQIIQTRSNDLKVIEGLVQ